MERVASVFMPSLYLYKTVTVNDVVGVLVLTPSNDSKSARFF